MNKPTFGTFRGWDEGHDEWVYGSYQYEAPRWPYGHGFYIIKHSNRDFIKVHFESLAMFTGFYTSEYDKKFRSKGFHTTHEHGKPVYASIPLPDGTMSRGGDIVRIAGVGIVECEYPNIVQEIMNLDSTSDVEEVLGNAYENPELLEGYHD